MTEKDKDGRPKKGGRPSKNITDKLTCKITVKLCHRDYFSFLIEAHAAGMRPSALARAAITGVRIVPRLTREEME